MKKIILHKNFKLLVLLFCLGGLTACQSVSNKYANLVEEQANNKISQESQANANESKATEIDPRLVPEFSQVLTDFSNFEGLELESSSFQSKQAFKLNQENFQMTVNQMAILPVDKMSQTMKEEAKLTDEGSDINSLVLVYTTIENLTDQDLHLSIEDITMGPIDDTEMVYADQSLYPSQSGNLQTIVNDSQSKLQGKASVDGYLVFSLTKDLEEQISREGHLKLSMNEPTPIDDKGVQLDLGNKLALFLPISEESETMIVSQSQFIADRLTTEFWGQKTELAAQNLETSQEEEGVTLTTKRVEVTDFAPFEHYEEIFKNFEFGQVIVSIEYEISNQTEQTIYPVDGQSRLIIGEDPIEADYVLINEEYGQGVEPGQSKRIIQTFALDKKRYQEVWQGQDYQFEIIIPNQSRADQSDTGLTVAQSEDSGEEETSSESSLEEQEAQNFVYVISYQPQLKLFVDDNLDLVDQLLDETSQSSGQVNLDSPDQDESEHN
ncbi:hypothetical protein [Eremococcus coleocola]|uniref:hypothetical protein n=1 Tax=Eremococcus coleocola TaxID=88132 RepID=UPI00041E1374|nr:hypothetical protein [Eremococcus coleocola]